MKIIRKSVQGGRVERREEKRRHDKMIKYNGE